MAGKKNNEQTRKMCKHGIVISVSGYFGRNDCRCNMGSFLLSIERVIMDYKETSKELFNETGFTEELTEANFVIPCEEDYIDFGEETEEWDVAAERPGLWENIRKKKRREGDKYKPA